MLEQRGEERRREREGEREEREAEESSAFSGETTSKISHFHLKSLNSINLRSNLKVGTTGSQQNNAYSPVDDTNL
ncbi:hypothetical protein D5086_023275 [Populus alba]|uniref:Uncharacterized protein n=1 Tax=Populus alba TaxID=43335 RepID=A0ACC4B9A6_POPAL